MDPVSLRVVQNTCFSLLTHTKQLLLVTFCCITAGIGASFRTHGNGRTEPDGTGWTDKRGSRNSYLDLILSPFDCRLMFCKWDSTPICSWCATTYILLRHERLQLGQKILIFELGNINKSHYSFQMGSSSL